MTDNEMPATRHTSKRTRVSVSDLTILVRVPGHPTATQAFTANETAAANAYASSTGGIIDTLPD